MRRFSAVVLAAGVGKRIGFSIPKILIPLCGKPMISFVVETLKSLNPENLILVVSPQAKGKIEELFGDSVKLAVQENPCGTGNALLCALKQFPDLKGTLLVTCGDTPLLKKETFEALIDYQVLKKASAAVLTEELENPFGYGRIVRDRKKWIKKIVEEKDADSKIKKIKEINTGTYCFDLKELEKTLPLLTQNNDQKEYYLTDSLHLFSKWKKKAVPLLISDSDSALGINTLSELSRTMNLLYREIREKLMNSGVLLVDPETIYVDAEIKIGSQTILYPFTILEKGTVIGSNCQIGPFTRVSNSRIGNEVVIQNSVLNEAEISDGCSIGPYAYLRSGTLLQKKVKIGDFVEVKKTTIGFSSKVPHLSYIGDADIGENVNIGAGTITCNYDGKRKYNTIIEDGAFIGSNTNLRAPVRIGKNAVTGAGSVVIKDVEADTVVAGVPAKVIKNGS
ncbi:MAG: bifunctional UDP-N-acetylglucosamine diphosphorylase/glucosamine-1-phosphate N-acetyltransferase GlmU [Candidatus Eremiobacteraeota bacterium]|nr:bifunctional UDP-N-acetylglucosamine diphosphorylase/glucosamine-1-phosphate N-acetyltransferase GlmU [Candidatus Eremiobacteraeota bacterium]